jgi:hypothetical protein
LSHVGVIAGFVICPVLTHCARGGCRHSREYSFVSGQETRLERARRHVREGTRRVERQEAIVAMLDRNTNYRPQAALAREILAILQASLHAMNTRLQAIEERSKG